MRVCDQLRLLPALRADSHLCLNYASHPISDSLRAQIVHWQWLSVLCTLVISVSIEGTYHEAIMHLHDEHMSWNDSETLMWMDPDATPSRGIQTSIGFPEES